MAKSLPERLNRSDVGVDIVLGNEKEIGAVERIKNVTATNDVSANLTLRQIDLSRNPIVACCMFSRAFSLFARNPIRPRSTSNLSTGECLLIPRSVQN